MEGLRGLGGGGTEPPEAAEHESGPLIWSALLAHRYFRHLFSFCETIGSFDLWRGIKSFAAQKLQMKR